MFGMQESEVAGLVRAVSDDDPDRATIAERFARAAWTAIAEPGDRVAGRLVEMLGAPRALDGLIERRDAAAFARLAPAIPFDDLEAAVARWEPRVKAPEVVLALRQGARFGARVRTPADPDWPRRVDELDDHAPLALWTRGTEEAFRGLGRSIALVGARAATGYGEHITMEASAGLVDRGYAIVSGAAYGIDGMAHRAALASGGQTIAFLAGGVDRFYPTGHEALLNRIVQNGVVVSEVPPGSAPTKWRFLQRNRLIAAASLATVVLEAGWRSGSLNTAHHADDLSRPVGAVPGPVTSAASAGCHKLIREGKAILVTTPDDMAELAPLEVHDGAPRGPSSDPEGTRVLDALSNRAPRTARDLAARSGLSVADTQAVLGRLELEGHAREGERGWSKVVAAGSGLT